MGKYKKTIILLVVGIVMLSCIASIAGLFIGGGTGEYDLTTMNGEIVKIYGSGLYKNDSISVVAQGKAADLVTLILGIPLLVLSLYLSSKDSFRGRLILIGTLGYFLYTYMSYSFVWMYNSLFIIYVILMSLSFYAFVLCFISFDVERISSMFQKSLPVKFLGGFQFFIGFGIGILWLGRLLPSVFEGKIPYGLEHYTTLVIQGMDLGFIVPTAFLSGILLIKRKPFGYLLTSVIIIKGITMLTCISAMILNQVRNKVTMSIVEIVIFPAFNLLAFICLVILMKNIRGEQDTGISINLKKQL